MIRGSMLMKMKFESFLNISIFLITILVQVVTIQYESDGLVSQVKYLVCLVGILIGAATLFYKKKNVVMTYELGKILQICFVFLVITIFFSLFARQYNNRAGTELVLMVLPIVYAFFLVNVLSAKQINACMGIILLISMCVYLFDLHMGFGEFVSALFSMNPEESYSGLESSTFAGVSIALALYYLYYRNNRFFCFLSVLFVFFTFKRLAMLVVILLIFLPKIVDCSKEVNKKTLFFAKIFIMGFSVGYFILLTPEVTSWIQNHWNFSLDDFTMGRSWRFRLVYKNPNFINTGLGSTWSFLHNYWDFSMEMDIVRLMIEVTPLGVFLLINNMLDIVKKNRYCFIVMIYLIFNLITSHSLASMFSWLMFYLIIGTIIYRDSMYHPKPIITVK